MAGGHVRDLVRHHRRQLRFVVSGENESAVHIEEPSRQREGVHFVGVEDLNGERYAGIGISDEALADTIDVLSHYRVGHRLRTALYLMGKRASQCNLSIDGIEIQAGADPAPADHRDVVLGCQVAAASGHDRVQLDYWRNNFVIWSHDLEVTQGNWIAEDLVGAALIKDGKLDAAMPHYYRAIAIRPDDVPSNLNIGAYQQRMGNMPEAIEHFKKVISLKAATSSHLTKAYTNLGYAERSLGNYAESRKHLEIAVQMKPTDAEAWTFLGTDAHRMGNFDAAAPAYSKAIEINPLSWRYLPLSEALEQDGHHEQSQKALDKAKMIALDFKETQKLASEVLGSEPN